MIRLKNILLEQNLPKKSIEWHRRVVTRLLNNEPVAPLLGTLENIKKYYPQADPEWKPTVTYDQVYDWLDNNSDLDTTLINKAFNWITGESGIELYNKVEVIKIGGSLGYMHLKVRIILKKFNISKVSSDKFKAGSEIRILIDDVTPGGMLTGLYWHNYIYPEIDIDRILLPIDKKTGKAVDWFEQGKNKFSSLLSGTNSKDLYDKNYMMARYIPKITLNMPAKSAKGYLPGKTIALLIGVGVIMTVSGGLLGAMATGALASVLSELRVKIEDNEFGIKIGGLGYFDMFGGTDKLKEKLSEFENKIKEKTEHKVPIGNIYDTLPDAAKQRMMQASIVSTAAEHGLKNAKQFIDSIK
jgi:hypothetical protein